MKKQHEVKYISNSVTWPKGKRLLFIKFALYQIHICGVGGKTLFMMMKTLKLEISSFSYITVQSESINRVL